VQRPADPYRAPSEHYENFPVASWLCPRHLRPPIAAIYWFARTADDLADEGDLTPAARLEALQRYRADLHACAGGQPTSDRWPGVFAALASMLAQFRLPLPELDALLDAFEQDVRYTAEARRYETDQELRDYCSRSANPVGRLLLHLYGVQDALSRQRSDQICTALQLINFWQDVRVDVARDRWYPSREQMRRHGVQESDLQRDQPCAAAARMLAACTEDAVALMHRGAPLATQLPGRVGWELRLVVQGGLRIAEKIRAMDHATWRARPTLAKTDVPLLLWRAWRMPSNLTAGPA
jgi:squalene synthase HpnC